MAAIDLSTPAHAVDGPEVRRIGIADLRDALAKGFADFMAAPTHVVFLSVIYPIVGLLLFRATFAYDLIPLLFPLLAGFALIGPFAAIGLYEISRVREQGQPVSWRTAFGVLKSRSLVAILILGAALMALFFGWLAAAQGIYAAHFGPMPPKSLSVLMNQIMTTPQGTKVLVAGNLVGFVFAVIAFTISVVSFPLLIDRNVGAATAIVTSIRAVLVNPVTMAMWAILIAGALVVGSLPLLVGLAIVMPVLGHATWHLYRKLVV